MLKLMILMQKRVQNIFLILLFCCSFTSFSQDSIPISANRQEENLLQFQEHFFKALAQKSILKFDVAIRHLEECNVLQPNNAAVYFEISKNYFHLNKTIEAVVYAKKALQFSPKNEWISVHLVTIYIKSRNFTEAIALLETLQNKSPQQNEQLIRLYFLNKQSQKAKKLLLVLDKNKQLTPSLRELKNRVFTTKTPRKSIKKATTLSSLISQFSNREDFETLQKILTLSATQNKQKILLDFSQKGIELFPAQAVVYLMHAKALHATKQFSKALENLQNGIDFVIENNALEADFYEEMAKCYRSLGNEKEAIKNKNKALKLRKNQ